MCKVEGCYRKSQYKEQDVCQMHYFRFMRNGTYELIRRRKYRVSNPAGYQKIYEPEHPLAGLDGYVYEHRYIYYNRISNDVSNCEKCNDPITWNNCHIDHIDCDVTNNNYKNLRALCRSCNVFRGHTAQSMGKHLFTVNGKTMTATAWSRMDDVEISGSTIIRRRQQGMNDYEAIYAPRVTHHNTKTQKITRKYDEIRGIKEIKAKYTRMAKELEND